MNREDRRQLAVIGIGSILAGDDGAGLEVVRRLQGLLPDSGSVFLHAIEGDHFEIAGLLDRAERFIIVDAVAGERPGEIVFGAEKPRVFAPSLHQADICSVMNFLESCGIVRPFPAWEIWGIAIAPPTELVEGLSPPVAGAVDRLCGILLDLLADSDRTCACELQ